MNLDKILTEHKQWLSDKATGKRASLTRASLEGAILRGVDLRYARLEVAILRCVDLRYANLYGASLRYADLAGTDLRYANLEGANLRGAKGIMQWQSPQGVKRICYSVKHDNCVMHQLGCFWGNTDEAVEAIQEKYGDSSLYEKFLLMQVEALECEE